MSRLMVIATEKELLNSPLVEFEDYFKNLQPGLILEFGVATGISLRRIMKNTSEPIWGFDSFEGLPEDWEGGVHKKGAFSCGIPTDLPSNITLVVGLFQDTLPKFLEEHKEPVSFVHLDCDLYSSHKFVLDCLKDRLNGVVVVFDDIIEQPQYIKHGLRAFNEFIEENSYQWECLGHWQPPSVGFRLYK